MQGIGRVAELMIASDPVRYSQFLNGLTVARDLVGFAVLLLYVGL